MSGIKLTWTIEGATELARNLQGMETSLKDFTKPLKRISDSLVKTFGNDVFSSKGSAIGETWAPLAQSTLEEKARLGYPSDPLIRTGAMKGGFKAMVSTDQALIGNEMDYFKYHQSNKPRSRIPRRVMMKLTENMKQMIVKEFQDYIRTNK